MGERGEVRGGYRVTEREMVALPLLIFLNYSEPLPLIVRYDLSSSCPAMPLLPPPSFPSSSHPLLLPLSLLPFLLPLPYHPPPYLLKARRGSKEGKARKIKIVY